MTMTMTISRYPMTILPALVEQGLQNIRLDEYNKKGAMEAATEGYITHTAQYFRVRDCIENMKLKQSVYIENFA
jgi:hypothetical protein